MKLLPAKISNLKNQISKIEKGFTLVELLVVIGVLGVLASGLLATIDPLEQFRRAADSNRRSTSLELTNALTRYYATHQAFPWDETADGGADCYGATAWPVQDSQQVSDVTVDTTFGLCLDELIADGELKSSFKEQRQILNKLWVTETNAALDEDRRISICFNPESKSQSRADQAVYNENGVEDVTNCGTAALRETNTNACYICTQ